MVGKQSGREIRPFETETGEELLFLYPGMRKQDEVFDYEHAQNRLQTWIYRLLGWLAMFLGYNCVSNLLDIIGKYLLRLPPMNIFRKSQTFVQKFNFDKTRKTLIFSRVFHPTFF